jgi:hypothetical protein
MVRLLAGALGQPKGRISRLPTWMLSALGVFMPLLREVKEMVYQFEEPYVVDDARFRARFGVQGTPLEEGARQTAAWAQQALGPAAVSR